MYTPYQHRQNLPYREALEKSRLKDRREKFTRFAVVTDPVQPASDLPHVASYENDHERNARRDDKSLSRADKQERETHQALFNQARRRKIETRESYYREKEDQEAAKQQEHIEFLRDQSNQRSCRKGYDIVSLEYKKNADGRQLRARDEYFQYKQKLRGYTLALRSGLCNNPITGEAIVKLEKPVKPSHIDIGNI